jgi:hypothetical protein
MTNLEKYIKDHHGEFDSHEPEPGHFKRFEDRLAARPELRPSRHNRSLVLRIAALIIVLVTVSVFVFDFATREFRERLAAERQGVELPLEIREAVQYYDSQTKTQMATLNKLAVNQEDAGSLNSSALNEINILDAATDELKKSLAENPGNEVILDAIIRNQQMKENMLNTIITQLSQYRK